MKINISNLSEGVHEYDFDESPADIKLDDRFSKPVIVRIELEKRRRQLFLTGHVATSGTFKCDRCLEDFDSDLVLDYRMAYVYDRNDAGDANGDEITVLHTSTNEIDIDDDVRQYMLLAVPLKLLCREDCAGLCPKCGTNLNRGACSCTKEEIDPRWEKLKKLANKN